MARYRGDEIKFAINIEAQGFNMDDDDFDIEVKSGNTSVKGYKDASKNEDTALLVFYEEEDNVKKWYAIVNTATLPAGQMRVISTAYIPDANADDGVRKSIDVKQLDRLIEP